MKISLDWLSDFVELGGIEPDQLAEQLTVRTAEVEGFEVLERSVAGVLVARVVSAEPLAGGSAHAVVVDLNGGRTQRTVCGAPNVRVGMYAAFAPAGTKLAGGKIIEAATVHGHVSEGVLCSPAELGMSSAHDGILECPDSTAPGNPIESLVPARDVLVEIDNKSLTHRPDLWGHYGFAREIAAIFGRELRPYETASLDAYAHLPAYPVEVESHEDCPVYSAIEVEVAGNPRSSLTIQRRLHALGLKPINALVDATNYVQFELGQPTHAFDARRIGRIRVARSGTPRKLSTLDGRTWDILPHDLLIWNGDEPVALAGVMGGGASQVVDDTRRILLESANFKASLVRTTSVRLALRTDASLRFEKKLPPLFAKLASARIFHVLERMGLEPRALTRYSAVGDLKEGFRSIAVPAGYVARRSGADIDDETSARVLRSIGFTCERLPEGGLDVGIPPFRSAYDISILEDISEEVMRLYGYDNITPALPVKEIRPAPIRGPTRAHHRIRRVLSQSHRFVEVQTYGWTVDEWTEALGYRPSLTLDVKNPVAANRRRMRKSLVPNVLAVVNQNRRVRESFRVYELGRVFGVTPEGAKVEEDELVGVCVDQASRGAPEHLLRSARGALDDLASAAALPPLDYAPSGPSDLPWIAAGSALSVGLRGELIGHIGLLPPALRPEVIDAGHAVWFALRVRPLEGEIHPSLTYKPPPVHPGSWQDFTFVVPRENGYAALSAVLGRFSHRSLERWTLIDHYSAKGSETGNYSIRFFVRAPDRTISAEEIQDFREAILAYIQKEGLKLV